MPMMLYHDLYRCAAGDDAPVCVMLHGWGMNSHVWDLIMPALLNRFSVMVVDLPGMGRSPLPSVAISLDSIVDQLLCFVPESAIYIGWSLGGMVAMRLAATNPARVSALITIAATPRFVQSSEWPHAMPATSLDDFRQLLEEDAQGTVIRFLALQCKGSTSMREDIRFLRDRVFHDGIPATRALREGLTILAEADLRGELASYLGPTLMVMGEYDPLLPVSAVNGIANLAPEVRLALIRGAAHLPFLTEPDLFIQALEDFAHEFRLV